jgi:hypothetical protein
MHMPLNRDAVRDAMPALFDLLREETDPGVRVVLGHFVFVYIHPYMDGNGRMGRFLMNTMMASGGYPWTVIPVGERSAYSRDAKALHALFTDTLGGETVLLTDEQATVAAIEERFGQLAGCSADDVVVVAFSGHGTETHERVGFDTNPIDLTRTTIPLTRLGEWCARIPSRRLLIVLDCCFSGGMGAKAVHVEGVPRDMQSVDGKLNQISGEGRVVLTASGPTERAWGLLLCVPSSPTSKYNIP